MKKNVKDTFAQVLREKRIASGQSATELARRIGRTQSYVSQLENGALHAPENDRIEELARALGCDSHPLFLAAGRLPPQQQAKILEAFQNDYENTAKLVEISATHGAAVVLGLANQNRGESEPNSPQKTSDK